MPSTFRAMTTRKGLPRQTSTSPNPEQVGLEAVDVPGGRASTDRNRHRQSDRREQMASTPLRMGREIRSETTSETSNTSARTVPSNSSMAQDVENDRSSRRMRASIYGRRRTDDSTPHKRPRTDSRPDSLQSATTEQLSEIGSTSSQSTIRSDDRRTRAIAKHGSNGTSHTEPDSQLRQIEAQSHKEPSNHQVNGVSGKVSPSLDSDGRSASATRRRSGKITNKSPTGQSNGYAHSEQGESSSALDTDSPPVSHPPESFDATAAKDFQHLTNGESLPLRRRRESSASLSSELSELSSISSIKSSSSQESASTTGSNTIRRLENCPSGDEDERQRIVSQALALTKKWKIAWDLLNKRVQANIKKQERNKAAREQLANPKRRR